MQSGITAAPVLFIIIFAWDGLELFSHCCYKSLSSFHNSSTLIDSSFRYFVEGSSMTHLLVQSRNDSEHEGTPQTDSLRDSSMNHAITIQRD